MLLAGSILAGLMLMLAAWQPGSAAGADEKRTCGTMPGDGAYSFVKTENVSCRIARKVSNRAGRKFCNQPDNCDEAPGAGYDKGRVRAKGWRCRMKVGYEFFRAECKRRDQRFIAESAA